MTLRTMKQKYLVSFNNEWYDLGEFAHKHPGGWNTLNGQENKDITTKFNNPPGHSKAAEYLMKEYKVQDGNNNDVAAGRKTVENHDVTLDESMEHLVDWSKAMLPQISKLGKNYKTWVNLPVDRDLKLFGSDYLEMLTKTPWWIVPSFWIPIIIILIIMGSYELSEKMPNYSSLLVFMHIIGGVFIWTLVEYSLHRWVFHVDTASGNKFLTTFHFLLHGLHHKVPFDPYRLVFPPVPAIILASIFYQPISWIFTYSKLVLAGGLIGYLCYDMIHYYVHYGSPSRGHLYTMKRYHYQHHFSHHDKGFGISNKFWDNIFGTEIFLRKLKYILKW